MYLKIKNNLITTDFICRVEPLLPYEIYDYDSTPKPMTERLGHDEEDVDDDINTYDYHIDVSLNSTNYYFAGWGFYVEYLNNKFLFIRLESKYEDSKRLYDEFIKYVSNNQSEIPEIK